MKRYQSLLNFPILLFILFGCQTTRNGAVDLLSPATDSSAVVSASAWEKEYWSNKRYYSQEPSPRTKGKNALIIDADSLSYCRWFKKVQVKPYAHYRLTGYIKTENVPAAGDGGVGFQIGGITNETSLVLNGNNDWTLQKIEFYTGGEDSFLMECILGKNGEASGKAYFDDIRLELLSSDALNPQITVHLQQTKEPMSDYIYGQFIEHMGKCIYGGIWAEMLEDRKFYYSPGDKKSAWKPFSGDESINIDSMHVLSPYRSLTIDASGSAGGIFQEGLGLKSGKEYVGRIVISAAKSALPITIGLHWGEGNKNKSEVIVEKLESGFQTISFKLKSDADSDNGKLTIGSSGNGQLIIGAVSLMPSDNIQGFRPDVLSLMKELKAPVYRWPGGNFVSGYNWEDGIGDRDKRPVRFEKAWNGLETNDVGIHEFMELCSLLNTEANIAVNTGLGTADMAAREVEYVNGSATTTMGKWRAENGHTKPYNVKLWAVGNEMFGDWQLGHMPVEEYVKKHNQVAAAMWKADSSIELIAVGYPGKWNDMMYEHCSDKMTYISEHFYKQDWHGGGLMTHVKQIPDVIRSVAEEHRRCRNQIPALKGKEIKIAMDEWNYWYGPHVYGLLGTRYFLQDALGIAAGLNEFSRQSDMYYMANYAQTVNVIGAIKTTKTASFLEATGEVLKLYRNEFGPLPVEISGDPRPLDIAATLSEDGKYLTVSVINATDQSYPLLLKTEGGEIKPTGEMFVITGTDRSAYNEPHQEQIKTIKQTVTLSDNTFTVGPISASIYKFEIKL